MSNSGTFSRGTFAPRVAQRRRCARERTFKHKCSEDPDQRAFAHGRLALLLSSQGRGTFAELVRAIEAQEARLNRCP